MSTLPPPAETLARVQAGTRLGLGPAGSVLHVLAGNVTRCGARTAAGWVAYGKGERTDAPCVRLCRRCLAGLPATTRKLLTPTPDELRRVHEREARHLAEDLRVRLAAIRDEALLDGSAYEGTRIVIAELPPYPVARRDAPTITRAARDAQPVRGHVATERRLSLLDLLNRLDPTRPDLAGHRVWLVDEPELGAPVDVGGTYDPRLWQGRKR